ncbi:uncharacterized protein LOC129192047 [Dunckerocampus dactyliophorus]|uniref:uncharacterized protein LOC129192047 n=1 Tax=Dunckerocampus dactyliophorus TaxID=161453 RepID=UPI002405B7AD|nr:uncharacterized protein LOC129192047 [Dunckerocampus dactyliophorus]
MPARSSNESVLKSHYSRDAMGSGTSRGTSRGTKVAPAGLSEANKATKTTTAVGSSKQHTPARAFHLLRIHARRRAPPADCHSAGHDSELSGDDEDVDAELDAVLAGYEEEEVVVEERKRTCVKKCSKRSRTYGLCHFSSREEDEGQQGASCSGLSGAHGPHGSQGANNNKRSHDAFTAVHKCSPQAFLTTGPVLGDAPPSSQQQITLATPVILYDGSEEELMDTIERDFS